MEPGGPSGEDMSEASRVVAGIARERDRDLARPWVPAAPVPEVRPGRAVDHPDLDWLHRHWAVPNTLGEAGLPRMRSGWRGVVWNLLARGVFAILARYLEDERELFAHLPRLHEASLREIDSIVDRHYEDLRRLREDLMSLAGHVEGRLARMEELAAQRGEAAGR